MCETVSYALDRSMYMARVGCFFRACMWSLSMMVWSARVVLELGRNAYCVGEMMLCVVRCVMSWLLMRVSSSLAMMGRREIWLDESNGFYMLNTNVAPTSKQTSARVNKGLG